MKTLKKGDKIFLSVVVTVILGVGVWSIFLGIKGMFLSEKHPMDEVFENAVRKDSYEGPITCVLNDRLVYRRKINQRWAGKEYYYIILSKERDKAVIVRAPENWLDNMGAEKLNQVSLEAKGTVKNLRHKVKEELEETISSLQADGIRINQTVYLDLLAKRICAVQLFAGISVLILTIYLCLFVKKLAGVSEKPISKLLFIVMLVWFFLAIAAFLYLRNKTW